MNTIMYAFNWFFKEKHCTLIVYITEFFLKSGGGPSALLPPPRVKSGGGGMAPWPPLWRTPWIKPAVYHMDHRRPFSEVILKG